MMEVARSDADTLARLLAEDETAQAIQADKEEPARVRKPRVRG